VRVLYIFIQFITKPTRCTPNSATLIDHFLSNNIQNNESGILTTKISDHFPIFYASTLPKQAEPTKYLNVRDFSKRNIDFFKEDLSQISWNNVLHCVDVHESFIQFSEIFETLYELRFPSRKIKFNKNIHKIEKWMTQGL